MYEHMIITNDLRVLQFAEQPKYINQQQGKKVGYLDTSDITKKAVEVAQQMEQYLNHGEFYP